MQIQAFLNLRKLDRIDTGESQNDALFLKPEVFNFQIRSCTVFTDADHIFELSEPVREVCQTVRNDFTAKVRAV
jgi:hypothetical protein